MTLEEMADELLLKLANAKPEAIRALVVEYLYAAKRLGISES